MSNSTCVLVVAAHPDDEVLGCGGVLARHTAAGDRVHVIFVADGVRSRGGAAAALEERRAACAKALAILGCDPPIHCGFVDQRLDSVPFLDITRAIERASAPLSPQVVYTHHSGDLNLDHRIVSRSVLTAFRPLPGQTVRSIYAFEVASSTEWAFGATQSGFAPNRFVDISDVFDTKMAALRAYADEMREFPHARSLEAVQALAMWRGASVGLRRAEAFQVFRDVVA